MVVRKIVMGMALLWGWLFSGAAWGAEKWIGVDEAVVGKIAGEHGRTGRQLLNLEGDAQLFVFLVAGVIGGFAAGYWWRMLVGEKRSGRDNRER